MKRRVKLLVSCGAIAAFAATCVLLRLGDPAQDAGASTGSAPTTAISARAAARPLADVVQPVTFNRDIARLVHRHCAGCHRPGQPAPFSLLSYRDVQKRAGQIAEVTASRYMPPWLPEPGYVDFADCRRMSDDEVELIARWVSAGAPEGKASDRTPPPAFESDWALGKPDLIVTMPEAYTLYADGPDLYRNFVVPAPVDGTRYVRAIEFRPGNTQGIHHAFVMVDRTGYSRRLDERSPKPGYQSMDGGDEARMPDGQLLSWQPGTVPTDSEPGIAWQLQKDMDLVLQAHLHPTGKEETIQASVGLYFTDEPPTKFPYAMVFGSTEIDVPPGEGNYKLHDEYVLPVDVEALKVLPHSHFLAREIKAWAILPDGSKQWLLRIERWNFSWQGTYRYAEPIFLPRGTRLCVEFILDNSEANVHNPNQPPKLVRYGTQSTDSMAELWLQVVPKNAAELATLTRHYHSQTSPLTIASRYARLLEASPNDARLETKLAGALTHAGRIDEAFEYLRKAIEHEPDYGVPHFFLGVLWTKVGNVDRAIREYKIALELNRDDFKSHDNLGVLLLGRNRPAEAIAHFETALRLDPQNVNAYLNLGLVAAQEKRFDDAIKYYEQAVQLDPSDPRAANNLRIIANMQGKP